MTQTVLPTERLKRFVRALSKDDAIGALIAVVESTNAEAFAFGGMPRDVLFGGASYFGDIDIFVSGRIDEEQLAKASRIVGRTNFGGLRLLVGKYDVDMWELTRSKVFVDKKTMPVSVPSLLSTVCFSTDAVSISFRDRRIVASHVFWDSLKERRIDFVAAPRTLDILQAVRAARAIAKHSLTPSLRVAQYWGQVVQAHGLTKILKAEEKWNDDRRWLDPILIGLVDEKIARVVESAVAESHRRLSA